MVTGIKRPAGIDGYAPFNDKSLKIDEEELRLFPNELGKLGEGAQGAVCKAYHPALGYVAYKKQNITTQIIDVQLSEEEILLQQNPKNKDLRYQLKSEIRERLFTSEIDNNPYILKFLAYVVKKNSRNLTGPKVIVGMLLEYMAQGSLWNVLYQQPDMVTLDRVKKWILQLARALLHCHQNHEVVHRDVKAENALLSDNYNHLKLCDFGFARKVAPKMTGNVPKSIHSAAPETIGIEDLSTYSYPCDVYSFGMFIYTVLNRMYPFMEIRDNKLKSKKTNYKFGKDEQLIKSDSQVELLGNLLILPKFLNSHKDDEEDEFRPKINRDEWRAFFFKYEFLREQYEIDLEILISIMKQCWRTDPATRPTMKEVVNMLDFHFESPIKMKEELCSEDIKKLKLYLQNESYYPVAFRHRQRSEEVKKPIEAKFYDFGVEKGVLLPGEMIDLQYTFKSYTEFDMHISIEYIKFNEESYLQILEERLILKPEWSEVKNNYTIANFNKHCWKQRQYSDVDDFFNGISDNQRNGKEPGKVGTVTFGWSTNH